MKSILYVGATLMIGASIYGFVDYQKTSHTKEFKNMYDPKDEKETPTPVIAAKQTEAPAPEKKMVAGKTILKKGKSPEVLSALKEPPLPVETIVPEKIATETPVVKEPATEIKVTKKLNYRLFSRAPLERKYIDKEVRTPSKQ